MIVKSRDAQSAVIEALDKQADTTRDTLKRGACISAASRLRADATTQRASELIDFYFAHRKDWAVIHDLRLRVGSHAIQINHVLVHDSIQVVCLDSRYMSCQLEHAENGKFKVVSSAKTRSISSPIVKMAKDIRLLKVCLVSIGWSPRRLGLKVNTDVKGAVLVASESIEKLGKLDFQTLACIQATLCYPVCVNVAGLDPDYSVDGYQQMR